MKINEDHVSFLWYMQNSSKFIQIPSLDDLAVFLNQGKDAQSTIETKTSDYQLNIDLGFANLEIQLPSGEQT